MRPVGAASHALLVFLGGIGALGTHPHACVVYLLPEQVLADWAFQDTAPRGVVCKPRRRAELDAEIGVGVCIPPDWTVSDAVSGRDISEGIVGTLDYAYSGDIIGVASVGHVVAYFETGLRDVIGIGHGLVGALGHAPLRFVVAVSEARWTSLHADITRVICVVSDVVGACIHAFSRVILGEKAIWAMRNA